jgi:hypothetical protein
LWVWTQGFSLTRWALYHFSYISSVCSVYSGDRVLKTIYLGWPQTEIHPISASIS